MADKLYITETLGGPGVIVSKYDSTNYQYIDGQNRELAKTTTNIGVDETYLAMSLANQLTIPGSPLYQAIEARIVDAIKNRLQVKIVPWLKDGPPPTFSYILTLDGEVIVDKDM